MNKIEAASPNAQRKVIDVQQLLGLPDDTPNPHLWYDPPTMPAVAKAMAADLAALEPGARGVLRGQRWPTFDASLQPWLDAIAAFKAKYARHDRRPRPSRSPTTSCRRWASTT